MVKFVCAENSRFAVTRFYNRDSFYKCFDFVCFFFHLLIYFAYMEYSLFLITLYPLAWDFQTALEGNRLSQFLL